MSGKVNNMWDKEESWASAPGYQSPQQQYGQPGGFPQSPQQSYSDYSNNYQTDFIVGAEDFNFQQSNYQQQQYPSQSQEKLNFFYDPPQANYASPGEKLTNPYAYDDEPPLLEELEIYPEEIAKKIKIVLNPFSSLDEVKGDYDLGGPLIFCLCFAMLTFISGAKVNFGYVYGISVSSCIFMYLLLKFMWDETRSPSFLSVASVLGYSLLPVVFLSGISIFFKLANLLGYCLSVLVVAWASWAASRGFTTLSKDDTQKLLVAYPCAILYGVFTLIVVF